MMRRAFMVVLLAVGLVQSASAQAPAWRFKWQAGQVLSYRVGDQTRAVEVNGDGTVETRNQVSLVKQWKVIAVDASGVATLQHSVASLRMETIAPSGQVLVFDSDKPAESTPVLREQMAKYMGVPLSTVRLDATGQLI